MKWYRGAGIASLFLLAGCLGLNVLHPRAASRVVTVSAEQNAEGWGLCYYQVSPTSPDRPRWRDERPLAEEKPRSETQKIENSSAPTQDSPASNDSEQADRSSKPTATNITVPDGDVTLTLLDCSPVPKTVWFSQDLGATKNVTVAKAAFASAQASFLLDSVGWADTRGELLKALELVRRVETTQGHLLAASAHDGLGEEREALAQLERAVQGASTNLPCYAIGTDTGPSRASVLTELGESYRRAGRTGDALRTYRLADAAWKALLEQTDTDRCMPDVASHWRVLRELVALGEAVEQPLLAKYTERVVTSRDVVAAEALLKYIVAHPNPDLALAEHLLFDTPILASPNGPYWTLHIAGSYPKASRPTNGRLASAVAELKAPPRKRSGNVATVQRDWYAIVELAPEMSDGGAPGESAPEQRLAHEILGRIGTVDDKFQASRDGVRWVETLALLLDGEAQWERISAAADADHARAEALFFRGLLRKSAGNMAGAVADFQAVRKLGLTSLVEFGMAGDLLASLPKAPNSGGQP